MVVAAQLSLNYLYENVTWKDRNMLNISDTFQLIFIMFSSKR